MQLANFNNINVELQKISEWLEVNKLSLNANKSKYMIFHHPQKILRFQLLTTLINKNIPRRYTKAKTHLPWITRELIRMQRRRNKSHKKAKQTGETVTGKNLRNSESKLLKH